MKTRLLNVLYTLQVALGLRVRNWLLYAAHLPPSDPLVAAVDTSAAIFCPSSPAFAGLLSSAVLHVFT